MPSVQLDAVPHLAALCALVVGVITVAARRPEVKPIRVRVNQRARVLRRR